MQKFIKWLLAAALLLVLVLTSVALALQHWVGSEDLRGRVEREASAALGVPVQLAKVSVDLWPLPAVALDEVLVKSQPPLTLQRVEARPSWAALLQGRLEVATLVVRNAVVPQRAIAAIGAAVQRNRPAAGSAAGGKEGSGASISLLPHRTLLDHVSWIDAKGGRITVDALSRMGDDALPEAAEVKVLEGRFAGARATLQRQPDHWALHAQIGGGTVAAKLRLKAGAKGRTLLQGEADTADVEVAQLIAPNRSLTGKLGAHTTLHSEFSEPAALVDALQSQTSFTVRNAVVHGIDLVHAVKTVGLSRGGETRLDTLAGQVATEGQAVRLNNLVASSGLLAATGNVAIAANGSLDGRVSVDLAASAMTGAVGVPLAIGGTLDSPTVQLTRGALVGAAIGTAIAPGVGTGAGAKLGDKLGQGLRGLFGK